ncbi:OLC1v1014626C1 [Oldenlandia corymbosa var. corymbosa]|uniref:OLC1v1014626C1 n=1 Tax=Oldenlandia corymbosa var. corymbosa TaxID=529605 RepID=A0AAV1E1G3_OLDCO|nr:OLC1v1014626C1 [Oldenlandia corymbosa var. corymbosa]
MVTSSSSSSRSKSGGAGFSKPFQRSLSPMGRFCSSSSTFAARGGNGLMTRSASPTRVNLYRSVSPTSSVRLSTSPRRSIVASPRRSPQSNRAVAPSQKKTCMCSPTTHPGSFRCSLHKSVTRNYHQASPYGRSSHQLNMRRSAMTNSLVRIGTVEGDLVKRALAALIRPSSHNLRRRGDFQPRPSRLSTMSKADDL